ncbi:MAG: MBOAT family protein [Lachnospiraceae bacterium]|nr:MBOAT family protein [Lachnospiraceae bacterium]
MVFSSITFLFYFLPITLIGYFILSFSRRLQNIWLLIVSLIFYAWGEPVYVIIMIGSIFVNWLMALIIQVCKKKEKLRKTFLIITVIANLGTLGVFKYTNFIIEIINGIAGKDLITQTNIALPIGISFFTFQAMSYVIDVYKEKAVAQKNLLNIGLYISFFPQLVAGPIVKYTTIEEQITKRKVNFDGLADGVCRFVEGLLKKILLANNLAIVADHIFELTSYGSTVVAVPVMLAWLGTFAFTLQLYYDFSAYSDMAIGLGRMFGFTLPENFRFPFVSKSIKEFMARWHMTLSAWFTQYVYKPLGGAKGENQDKMVRNLFIVWLLTGIWHGASWNFIWWGMFFFIFILLENILRFDQIEGHNILKHVYVIFIVMIAMVIFKCENTAQLILYMKDMFGLGHNGFYSPTVVMFIKEYGIVFIAAILCALPLRDFFESKLENCRNGKVIKGIYHICYIVGMFALIVFSVAVLAKGGYNPFIYFNF